ncbi:MAG: hypothetical protein AAF525_02225 [Pseudomonadota bacterium]
MTLIHERVALARRGDNPCVVCSMRSGWVVLGDIQNQRGYCVLLADPIVGSINDLTEAARISFSTDMWAIGDALLHVTDAFRINYSVLGNKDAALHAHIISTLGTKTSPLRHVARSYLRISRIQFRLTLAEMPRSWMLYVSTSNPEG